jgi:adenylate cyclase
MLDPAKVPLMSEPARQNLSERYMVSDRKRAFVMGRNHFDWWAPNETEADAIKRNLQSCGQITGRPCVVYAIEKEVVVRTPQVYRIVDILTPQDLNLDAIQQERVDRYLVANDWRAIAVGRNGRVGMAVGRPNEAAAVDDALHQCAQSGGTECAISAVGPFLVAPK